jgi:hypothetical protein
VVCDTDRKKQVNSNKAVDVAAACAGVRIGWVRGVSSLFAIFRRDELLPRGASERAGERAASGLARRGETNAKAIAAADGVVRKKFRRGPWSLTERCAARGR